MKKIFVVKDKESFIKSLPPLTNVKVMTLSEIEDKILGSYNNEARTYLYLNKKIPLNLLDVYLKTFKYLNNEDLNEKIKKLNNLKNELVSKKLYFYDEIFINSLKNTEITFKGFIKNKHLDKIITYFKDKCSVKVEYLEVIPKKFNIHQYKTLEEELDDVIYKVMKLLEQGININNIKLMNVNSEYYPCLNRILSQYKLPYINLYDSKLDTSNYVIKFINNINELGVKESIKLLDNPEYDLKILDVINSYAYLDDIESIKELIIKDLKNIKINKTRKDNYLELVDMKYKIKENDYIFFLNFNNGSAPIIFDDSDLITDNEYDQLGELNSALKTNLLENELLAVLDKCYYISYKLSSLQDTHIPSYLVYKYELNVIDETGKHHILYDHKYYSKDLEKFNYATSRDHYFKTKEKTEKYECLAYNFKKYINNKTYEFTGLDKAKLKDALNSKFNVSYSTLNTYYKCKFAYYLNSIMYLNPYENTLSTIRGNVFHKLLEECEKEDFDYDTIFENKISEFNETNNKIRFFSSLIKDEFYMVKEFNEELLESTTLKNILHEYNIEFHKLVDDYDITIKGTIDKVMSDDNHIALIDFKSGSTAKFKLDNLYYGLDLQLPMYAYFISKDEKLNNKQIAGLYLQYTYRNFNDKQLLDKDRCKKEYRLDGYSNEALEPLISNDKSKFIAHQKSVYSSLIMNNIASFTENKIDEAIEGIINADFKIDPHTIDGKSSSCDFCKFKDVCYFRGKRKDYKSIAPTLFLSNISNRQILLDCLKMMKDENVDNEVNNILSLDDLLIDDKLKELIIRLNPQDEKIQTLFDFVNRRKEEK